MTRKHPSPSPLREQILDAALQLAEQKSWEAVRLQAIAEALQIDLNTIRLHYREKEDLVEAWFDRADQAMLDATTINDFAQGSARERLHRLMMAWLDALAAHRRVTRQMIAGKLEPGHLHNQIPALLRISRTVQWVREAAGREALFLQRALEEIATTGIYLVTFMHWMFDDTQDSQATRQFLERRLRNAESLAHYFSTRTPPTPSPPKSPSPP